VEHGYSIYLLKHEFLSSTASVTEGCDGEFSWLKAAGAMTSSREKNELVHDVLLLMPGSMACCGWFGVRRSTAKDDIARHVCPLVAEI